MPRSEREPGAPNPENQALPRYSRVARFAGEQPAGKAYIAAQEAIYGAREELDLSAFRFHLDRVWHVCVLGEPPPPEIDEQVRAIVEAGEAAVLPEEVLTALNTRRLQQIRLGPWVQRHHRPGKRLT